MAIPTKSSGWPPGRCAARTSPARLKVYWHPWAKVGLMGSCTTNVRSMDRWSAGQTPVGGAGKRTL